MVRTDLLLPYQVQAAVPTNTPALRKQHPWVELAPKTVLVKRSVHAHHTAQSTALSYHVG